MLVLHVREDVAHRLRHLATHLRDPASSTEDQGLEILCKEIQHPPAPMEPGWLYDTSGLLLTHDCLIEVSRWAAKWPDHSTLISIDMETHMLSLASLLAGARVAIAKKPPTPRSQQLIESLQKIENDRQQMEYETMLVSSAEEQQRKRGVFDYKTDGGKRDKHASFREDAEWKEVQRQLGAIANVALSVIAVVVAVWWAGGTASPIWKTLVAMPIAILVAVAEVVLYARHWDNAQRRQAKKALRSS